MDKFLSCDWGTSSFRLRLVEVATLKILAEEKTDQGIASTYKLWQQTKKQDTEERMIFYLDLVREHISKIEKFNHTNLQGVPLIFSGMASSSIGMLNLSYGILPFHTNGRGIKSAFFEKTGAFDHPILLISGVQSENDVMRGEETQLIGVIGNQKDIQGESLYIFPGTHSKYIHVKDQQAIAFKTYMTGEFFKLLSEESILSISVAVGKELNQKENVKIFKEGVQKAVHANLLNSSFRVRTNGLFGKMNKKENLHFLSGLLIGTELKELLQQDSARIYLCCSSNLRFWYETAMTELKIKDVHISPERAVDQAVVKGQLQIYNQLKNP